ncbi:MAG: methyltransferase family protein [Candidatus Thorarchaeota archaeon]|jgi:protein-S-isoprenylcysteine O-methyltransferase Ste14
MGILDFMVAGILIGPLALVDVFMHIRLDMKKARTRGHLKTREPSIRITSPIMLSIYISTSLSFLFVLILSFGWLFELGIIAYQMICPIIDPPLFIWGTGVMILTFGIIIHAWSRAVRQEMASSWAMCEDHQLITIGPYSRIRNPSYASYFSCFIGILLALPSILALLLLVGFPGYYLVAVTEEKLLLSHFGEEYQDYIASTGRFLPKL